MAARRHPDELLEAIADGAPVDWAGLAAETANEEDLRLVDDVRRVARVIHLHREASAMVRRAGTARPMPDAGSATPTVSSENLLLREGQHWGPLKILETLAEGGRGTVYRAWDSRLDREVALKLLHDSVDASAADGEPLVAEGRLLAKVRHERVVAVFGAEKIDGRTGIWMELVRGRTLEALLHDQGSLGASEVIAIGLDLCRALAAVHAAGLLHRDIKAQNVMREDGGRIVLMDLGEGRERVRTSAGHDLTGTPLYLAPEVLERTSASVRSDIYSLGVLLYRLVTASFPVPAASLSELRAAHQVRQRIPLRDVRPDLPTALVQVIEQAIAISPEERFESAGSMEAALAAISHPSGLPEQAAHGPRWRWWIAASAAALVLTAVALYAWAVTNAPRVTFEARDWILVAGFTNATGESRLDRAIEYAVEHELASSGQVNVVPRERVDDALKLMQQSTDSQLDASLARQVALRDGSIRAVVTGRIDKTGSRYTLRAQLLLPGDGSIVAAETEEAGTADQLTIAVQRLVINIRERLGEAGGAAPIAETVEPATTPSLDAVRLYTESFRAGNAGRWGPALELVQQAVAADPAFATGHIWLAWALRNNQCPPNEYRAVAERAVQLSEALTGPERTWILGSYYYMINDLPSAERAYLALLQQQPDHHWAASNLTILYRQLGRVAEALPHVLKLAALRPNNARIQMLASQSLVQLRDFARARQYAEQAQRVSTDADFPPLAWAAHFDALEHLTTRDASGVSLSTQKVLNDIESYPESACYYIVSAAVRYFLSIGQARHAIAASELLRDRRNYFRGINRYPYWRSSAAVALGDLETARSLMRPVTADNFLISSGLLLARLGLHDHALAITAGTNQSPQGNLTAAVVAVAKGDVTESVLNTLRAYSRANNGGGFRAPASAAFARALLRLNQPEAAIAALEESIKNTDILDPQPPSAYEWGPNALWLADMYRRSGRPALAEPIEADLARLLAAADEDFPLLLQLRRQRESAASR